MRITSVEVIPYALPFREPYVTARGSLDQREMVLLRLRHEDGPRGPRRSGAAVAARRREPDARVVGELELLGELERAGRGQPRGGIAGLSAPARWRAADGADRSARRGRRPADALGGNRRPAVAATRPWSRGQPAAVAARGLRWAAEGFSTFKLKLGAGDDVTRCGRCARRSGRSRGSASTPTPPGTWTSAASDPARLEELDIELAEQPVATLEEMAELAAATSIPIAADESIESLADAERAVCARRLRPGRGQALQGRRAGGSDRDRRGRCPPTSPAPSTARSGSPRRPRPRRRCARRAGGRRATSPTAWPPSDSSPRPSPRSSASCATAMLHLAAGPGLGVEIDERRSTCTALACA